MAAGFKVASHRANIIDVIVPDLSRFNGNRLRRPGELGEANVAEDVLEGVGQDVAAELKFVEGIEYIL